MDNIDFNDLWKKQTVRQPDMQDLLSRVSVFKKAALRSLWMTNIMLLATSIFIIFIWIYFKPKLISTKIGIVLVILAMVVYLLVYNKLFGKYKGFEECHLKPDLLMIYLRLDNKLRLVRLGSHSELFS